jgi:hypothetical protein
MISLAKELLVLAQGTGVPSSTTDVARSTGDDFSTTTLTSHSSPLQELSSLSITSDDSDGGA